MRTKMIDGSPAPSLGVRALTGVVLTCICATIVVPFIGIISTSLASPQELARSGGFVLIPAGIDLGAYKSIFAGGVVTRAMVVSILVTVVGTALSLVTTTLLAWTLSRRGALGTRIMLILILFSLLFSPGIIPTYLAVQQFGLINSYWALIIPTLINAFNVVVMRSFFVNLPGELIDSGRIDGASEWHLFRHIGLPLSKAVVAVIGLFYAVSYWNAFFNALLYLNDASTWPLQMVLRTYVVNGSPLGAADLGTAAEAVPPQASVQMAILIVSIVPILLIYPFLQKHFASGVMTGAVKG